MMRARVAHCIDDLSRAGGGAVVQLLVLGADRRRFEPLVYTFRDGAIGDEIRAANVPVHVLGRRLPLFDPALVARLRRRLVADRVDLVHTHFLGSRLHSWIASALGARVPHVATIHGLADRFSWRERVGERLVLRHMARVVAVSHVARNALELIDHRVKAEALVIPNGIDVARVATVRPPEVTRQALGLGDTQPVVVTVGRLHPIKGHTFLLHALARVVARYPAIVLLIVGKGELLPDLTVVSSKLGIGDHVRFLGERADVSDIVAASDVFVLSSVSEATPLALLEAMAVGRACVATEVGGIPEIITHGDNGLLAPPRDSEALATCLSLLLGDSQLRQRLGEAARRTVQDRFDARQMVSAYESLYAQVLEDSWRVKNPTQ